MSEDREIYSLLEKCPLWWQGRVKAETLMSNHSETAARRQSSAGSTDIVSPGFDRRAAVETPRSFVEGSPPTACGDGRGRAGGRKENPP
jgi:hypothetical protein